MNAIKNWLLVFCTILLANGCAPLRTPVIVRNAPIEMYKYAYISPTKELTSSTGGTYGGQYGIYGSSTTKSVNPSDVIAGILIKQGYIILPELKSELANETLIVNIRDHIFLFKNNLSDSRSVHTNKGLTKSQSLNG